jgi:hypothetical protein
MGFGPRASRWFFVSACIIRAAEGPRVSSYIEESKDRAWRNYGRTPPEILHWRNLKHPQKLAIAPIFSSRNYTQIIVGFWKSQLNRQRMLQDNEYFYRYACRLLLERVSWYVDDLNGWVRIIFSNTRRFDLHTFRQYISALMREDNTQIRAVFDVGELRVSDANAVQLLSLPDNSLSAFANAFNPDNLDNLNYFYSPHVVPHLYSYQNRGIWRYGFKVMPHEITVANLQNEYPFTQGWF